jgi:hypothetical protein
MGTNAPGQLLGYGLQFPRALYHLLRCEPEDKVAVEFLGDVATLGTNGSLLAEEDKSSQVGNPVTDLSIDLWKTFYNWVVLVNDDKIDITKTKFVLYVNQKGRNGIVNSFSNSMNQTTAKDAIENAKKKLKKVDSKHAIWQYYNYLFNQNESKLLDLICNFELQIGLGGGSETIKTEIKKKHIHDTQIDFIHENLSGWLQIIILEKLARKDDAIISWEEFNKQFTPLFERARKRELIDFTLTYPPDVKEIKKQLKDRPLYIKQLEEIKADDDDIQQAVTDFLKAKVNRYNWIEKELIDETTAIDFEKKLTEFWKNYQKKIHIIHGTCDSCQKGMLVYTECRSRQETIKDQNPPSATIAGTYHSLANALELGWHPDWETSFKKYKK